MSHFKCHLYGLYWFHLGIDPYVCFRFFLWFMDGNEPKPSLLSAVLETNRLYWCDPTNSKQTLCYYLIVMRQKNQRCLDSTLK